MILWWTKQTKPRNWLLSPHSSSSNLLALLLFLYFTLLFDDFYCLSWLSGTFDVLIKSNYALFTDHSLRRVATFGYLFAPNLPTIVAMPFILPFLIPIPSHPIHRLVFPSNEWHLSLDGISTSRYHWRRMVDTLHKASPLLPSFDDQCGGHGLVRVFGGFSMVLPYMVRCCSVGVLCCYYLSNVLSFPSHYYLLVTLFGFLFHRLIFSLKIFHFPYLTRCLPFTSINNATVSLIAPIFIGFFCSLVSVAICVC